MSVTSTASLLRLFREHPSICTDTRKLQPGDLYWALKGANFDGNRFAAQALEQGAARAVVDDPEVIPEGVDRYVLVKDGLKDLQALARAYRRTWKIPVIGLTGSNGKTTTKELLAAALRPLFRVHATPGNYNNHIGVPLTLLGCPADAEIAIVEMGTNQPGDIRELAELAEPDLGLITNIGEAHLEKLQSLEGVQEEKSQLFEKVKERKGWIFVNEADERVKASAGEYLKQKGYGTPDSDLHAEILHQDSEGMRLRVREKRWVREVEVRSVLSGEYNAQNIAAAIIVAAHSGVVPEQIAEGIAAYVPANHRSQLIEREGYRIWMDAYNANPSSMNAAVRHVMSLGGEQVAMILGDMYELGNESERYHRELGKLVNQLQPALLIGIGEEIRHTLAEFEGEKQHFPDTESAENSLPSLIAGKDLVLMKASRSVGLERLLEVV